MKRDKSLLGLVFIIMSSMHLQGSATPTTTTTKSLTFTGALKGIQDALSRLIPSKHKVTIANSATSISSVAVTNPLYTGDETPVAAPTNVPAKLSATNQGMLDFLELKLNNNRAKGSTADIAHEFINEYNQQEINDFLNDKTVQKALTKFEEQSGRNDILGKLTTAANEPIYLTIEAATTAANEAAATASGNANRAAAKASRPLTQKRLDELKRLADEANAATKVAPIATPAQTKQKLPSPRSAMKGTKPKKSSPVTFDPSANTPQETPPTEVTPIAIETVTITTPEEQTVTSQAVTFNPNANTTQKTPQTEVAPIKAEAKPVATTALTEPRKQGPSVATNQSIASGLPGVGSRISPNTYNFIGEQQLRLRQQKISEATGGKGPEASNAKTSSTATLTNAEKTAKALAKGAVLRAEKTQQQAAAAIAEKKTVQGTQATVKSWDHGVNHPTTGNNRMLAI